jgi:NTE family protein
LLTKAAYAHADVLFKPVLGSIDLLDWQACDQAIEAGYQHAVKKLEELDKPLAN